MARFPIEYEVDLQRGDASPYELRAAERPPIMSGPPPEFDGSDRWWSPEHLFVSAVTSCFAATFAGAARHATLNVGSFQCHGKGYLDRSATDAVAFTSVHLSVRARVASDDVERTQKLLAATKARCFVANSLRCPVDLSIEVTAS